MTAALSVSFIIRNTSPIGWPPLLLMKIAYDGSLKPILMAGFFVFFPLVAFGIGLDSLYFGEFPVITSYNFIKANILDGKSNYFGVESASTYIYHYIPKYIPALVPALIVGLFFYTRDCYIGGRKPYMLVLCATYLGVFSAINHKEERFMLPIVPFIVLISGYAVEKITKAAKSSKIRNLIKFYILVVVVVEVISIVGYNFYKVQN